MDFYLLPLRISSSILVPIGIIIQGYVFYLINKRHYEHESRGYELFLKIYSISSIMWLIFGWLSMARYFPYLLYRKIRVVMIPGGVIIYIFGIASAVNPGIYGSVDIASRASELFIQILVPFGMILRTILAFHVNLTKLAIGLAVILLFVVGVFPYWALSQLIFTDPTLFRSNLSLDEWENLRSFDAYGANVTQSWINIMYNYVYPNCVLICQFVTILFGLATFIKLKYYTGDTHHPRRIAISMRQVQLNLLFTAINSLYSIEVIIRLLVHHEIIRQNEITLCLAMLNPAFMSLIPIVQGILTIAMVPYLWKEFLVALEPKEEEEYFPPFVHIEHIEMTDRNRPPRIPRLPRSTIEEVVEIPG